MPSHLDIFLDYARVQLQIFDGQWRYGLCYKDPISKDNNKLKTLSAGDLQQLLGHHFRLT